VQQALRPYATAGVAIVAASLIAVTPMAPRLPEIQMRDVALTSGETDLLTPWIDEFNTASENTTTLLNSFYEAPGVGLQQYIANQAGFLQDFFNDPTSSTVTSVSQEMQQNLASILTGYTLQNATSETTKVVTAHTLDNLGSVFKVPTGHSALFSEIPSFLPASDAATVTQILDFMASPSSGIIIGELGPYIAPWVALGNSITAGDDFNETLANMVGAYFNGATLNLDSLIPAIEQADVLPAGMNIENLDFAFGGLLTPGEVGPITDGVTPDVGGSIFNGLGIDLTGVPVIGQLEAISQPVGPLGAWEGWAQTIASLLGWDGSGSPLADVTLPTIPTDLLDGGASAATVAADLSTWVQDLLAAF